MSALRQLGLVVHPTRNIEGVVQAILDWSTAHGVAVGQVPITVHVSSARVFTECS